MIKIIVDFNLEENKKYVSKQSELIKIGFKQNKESSFILEKKYLEFDDLKACLNSLKLEFKFKFQLRDDTNFEKLRVRSSGFITHNFVNIAKLLKKDEREFDVITAVVDNKILNYMPNEETRIHFITEKEKIEENICSYRTGKPATVWDALSHWAFDSTISYIIIDKIVVKRRVVVIAKFIEE